MANKIKGEVSLEYAGETFTIQFGFETLVLVEDKRNRAFGDVVEELKAGRLGSLAALLWAGVHAHHPEVTFEAAGRIAMALTQAGRGEELQVKIVEAVNLGFPSAKEVDASAARPPKEADALTSSDASESGAN